MAWWIWVLIGFALLAIEAATNMVGVGFFGIGAMVLALVVGLGFADELWVQLLVFTIVSVALLVLFRQPLIRKLRGEHRIDTIDAAAAESVVALEDIGVSQLGKAEMRGSPWNARNVGDQPIARGQRCRVERVEGLTLEVRSI